MLYCFQVFRKSYFCVLKKMKLTEYHQSTQIMGMYAHLYMLRHPCVSNFVRTFIGIYAACTHICDLLLFHSEECTISCTVLVYRESKFISISQMMTLKMSPQSFHACRNISPGTTCGSLFLPKVISFMVRMANLCKTYGNPSRCVINVNIWDSWWRDCKSGGI